MDKFIIYKSCRTEGNLSEAHISIIPESLPNLCPYNEHIRDIKVLLNIIAHSIVKVSKCSQETYIAKTTHYFQIL